MWCWFPRGLTDPAQEHEPVASTAGGHSGAALLLPVRSGATRQARELADNLSGSFAPRLEDCCERLGIERMSCHLAVLPTQDFLILHLEGSGCESFLSRLENSPHPFDLQLSAALAAIVGAKPGRAYAAQQLLPLFEFAPQHSIDAR